MSDPLQMCIIVQKKDISWSNKYEKSQFIKQFNNVRGQVNPSSMGNFLKLPEKGNELAEKEKL